ncbi:MAG: hypothetical protein M3275_01985 [Thermoproteota archaeon]|nr:hypothetical protein [Thermoproteota archaeon]
MPRSYHYKEGVIRFANPNQRFKCDKCDRPATRLFFLDAGEKNNTFIHKDMIMHVFCDHHNRENYLVDHLPSPNPESCKRSVTFSKIVLRYL